MLGDVVLEATLPLEILFASDHGSHELQAKPGNGQPRRPDGWSSSEQHQCPLWEEMARGKVIRGRLPKSRPSGLTTAKRFIATKSLTGPCKEKHLCHGETPQAPPGRRTLSQR